MKELKKDEENFMMLGSNNLQFILIRTIIRVNPY